MTIKRDSIIDEMLTDSRQRYKIVSGYNAGDLELKVRVQYRRGWVSIGGISIDSLMSHPDDRFYQAMISTNGECFDGGEGM